MKETFTQLINQYISPFLKSNDFKKKGLTFYRYQEDLIFVINFQNSHANNFAQTEFYINCGIYSAKIDTILGKPLNQMPKEYECFYRSRIEDIIENKTKPYCMDEQTDITQVGIQLKQDLTKVIEFYKNFSTHNDFEQFILANNVFIRYKEFFAYLLITKQLTKAKQLVNQLYHHFGKEPRWQYFENNLQEILNKHLNNQSLKDFME